MANSWSFGSDKFDLVNETQDILLLCMAFDKVPRRWRSGNDPQMIIVLEIVGVLWNARSSGQPETDETIVQKRNKVFKEHNNVVLIV